MPKLNNIQSVIVDRRPLHREGLGSLLSDTTYKIVATLATMSELQSLSLRATRPTLIILGLGNGINEAVKAIQEARCLCLPPDVKFVVVAESAGTVEIRELLESGANGVIVNVSSRTVLIKALDLALLDQDVVVMGHQLFPVADRNCKKAIITQTARTDVNGHGPAKRSDSIQQLSQRERQILACLTRGESNKLIARNCSIAEATVKVHLKAILRKIAVRNRTQAALWASAHHMLDESGSAYAGSAARCCLMGPLDSQRDAHPHPCGS
jgi:two-component system nitrate/nitrite response regulator NarL